ncbi:hypothetical protein TNCV_4245211 [Trichonephila clavipes]|nr:hypothetical protein TNCV_4245211 [Trichonephila clavipes]
MHIKSALSQNPPVVVLSCLIGLGSLVVKATDSRRTCYEFGPRATEELPCGVPCTLNMSSAQRPPIGVVWKFGVGVPALVSSSSLDRSLKLRDPSPKALK